MMCSRGPAKRELDMQRYAQRLSGSGRSYRLCQTGTTQVERSVLICAADAGLNSKATKNTVRFVVNVACRGRSGRTCSQVVRLASSSYTSLPRKTRVDKRPSNQQDISDQ